MRRSALTMLPIDLWTVQRSSDPLVVRRALTGEMILWFLDQIPARAGSPELLDATQGLTLSIASKFRWPLLVRGLTAVVLGEALSFVARQLSIRERLPTAGCESLAESS